MESEWYKDYKEYENVRCFLFNAVDRLLVVNHHSRATILHPSIRGFPKTLGNLTIYSSINSEIPT